MDKRIVTTMSIAEAFTDKEVWASLSQEQRNQWDKDMIQILSNILVCKPQPSFLKEMVSNG